MSRNAAFTALTDVERDAVTEIANIAMGRAATSLRQMVQREVLLKVPRVSVMSDREAVATIGAPENSSLIAVREDFRGLFSGRALLIFPEDTSLELVRAIVGSEMSVREVIELEGEAITETGNIVLNCWISTLANLLKHNLTMSVPTLMRGSCASMFQGARSDFVLFLHIDFAVKETRITGYLCLVMDLPSMDALRALIGDFIKRVGG
jgi:chemotaxis protein CheC